MKRTATKANVALTALALLVLGCGKTPQSSPIASSDPTKSNHIRLSPGADVQKQVQRALIEAKPGTTIEFAAGVFEFTMGLSLSVDNITIKGQGHDKTILSFKNQNAGKEGLIATGNGLSIQDLAVEDTKGDAIKVNDSKCVTFRNVRTEWTGSAKAQNGAYGLYPVQCTDVLIEGCVAKGASDAGIYVGQSKNIVVRRSRAEGNVAGIEIENSFDADVFDNVATGNTGGILVFDLPNLPMKNGGRVRVFDNQVIANNHPNFAPKGNTVADVPPGTGIMVMATDNVEVFRNKIADNQTVAISVISFLFTQKKFSDSQYDPYPETIYVHDNAISGCGAKPSGAIGALLQPLLGTPLPDIIYDGIANPKKLTQGKLPKELGLALANNGKATFANLQFDKLDLTKVLLGGIKVDRDANAFAGAHPSLPAVQIAAESGGK